MREPRPAQPDWHDSTCRALAHQTRHRPDAVAIVHRDVATTYRDLAAQVLATMDDLTTAGISPGQVIGVETGDRHLHLLIALAAEALGVTTMSLRLSELGPPAHLERLCDRIITSEAPPLADPDKFLPEPPDWLANIVARPVDDHRLAELEREPDPDAIARLIKSSGTTGAPKVMGMTHRVQQRVIEKCLLHAPPWVTAHPDFLCLYPFVVRASYARTLATLQLGGTVHMAGSNVVWDLIEAGIGNYTVLVAGDLERLVRAAPLGRGPFPLYLDVIGAEIPARLRQETRAKLTEHIMVTYSSNEGNRVSVVDDDNVGTLFPGVQVRIVDEQGKPLPIGQTGLICLKSDTMTDGYVNAPDLTRATFVDGWFRTSDVGFQPSDDKLVVLGRDDDMLNVGGLKIAPGPIEQRLKAIVGIRDALVTSIDDHMATRVMLVAIETAPDSRPADLIPQIMPIVYAHVRDFQLMALPEFPRTETGKIQREAVKELYRQQSQNR
jgi:acyl-CoA synthetase (AMP-forming)/AMP-acid ligase II